MAVPKDVKERASRVNGKIEQHGKYWAIKGNNGFGTVEPSLIYNVAYVILPKNHPDVGKGYDDLDPDVNGGLTFSEGRIFGWDYCHADNRENIDQDIKNALEYFRGRE